MALESLCYQRALARFVADYTGTRARAIVRAPEVFALYSALFVDHRLPRDARAMVASVLAYFVVPDDVMPEELGPMGLLDDLYAAGHAYRVLRRELPHELIDDAWPGPGNVDEVMAEVYSEARAGVGKRGKSVLGMAGLA